MRATSCTAMEENITRHTKKQQTNKQTKPQFEDAEQTLEPDMAGMLEFITTIINMLRAVWIK